MGRGDAHQRKWDEYERIIPLDEYLSAETQFVPGHCIYSVHIYPADENFISSSSLAIVFALVAAICFAMMVGVFVFYDGT